jgi:glycosyltransferase involved in cell wall biosynthesis
VREITDSALHDDISQRALPTLAAEPSRTAPSYCIFDGLQWESTRGLGRFAAQLQRHLEPMGWRPLVYPRPQWRSPVGRVMLNQIVEPIWLERLKPEVAIYPHNVLPALFASHDSLRVLVLHDVLFLDNANQNAGNQYRKAQLKRSLVNADLIVTVSEASRSEILRLVPNEKQTVVIPNALARSFETANPAKKGNSDGPVRILHFGGHTPSKNTKAVMEAVSALRRDGFELHLFLAAMSENAELLEQWRRESGLPATSFIILPRLSDEELKRVYAEATLHCMPSTGEGFGIPIIEAARCGTVNVLSPLPVFRELIGNDAIFAASFDAESIARALKEGLSVDVGPIATRARARTDRYLFESVHTMDAYPIFQAIEKMAFSRRKDFVRTGH